MSNLIAMSRGVSDQNKIQGNSLPEIRDAWKQASLDLARDPEIRAATRGALRDGNLLNAFLIYCLSLPDAEMKGAAAWGLRALERLKESDRDIDLRKISRDEFRALGGDLDSCGSRPATRQTGSVSRGRKQSQRRGTG